MEHLDEGTVHAWLDGALSEDEGRRIEEHASSCSECSALIAEARGFIAASSRILSALDDVPRVQRPEAKAPTSQVVNESLRRGAAASPNLSASVASAAGGAPVLRVERPEQRATHHRPWWARPQLSAAAVLAVVALGSFVVARNRQSAIPSELREVSAAAAPMADSVRLTAPMAEAAPQTPAPTAPAPNESKKDAAELASGGAARAGNAQSPQRAANNVVVTPPPVAPPVVAAKAVSDSAVALLAASEATAMRKAAAPAPPAAAADVARRPDSLARARQEGETKTISRALDPNRLANIEKERIRGEPQLQTAVVTGAASAVMVRAADVVACWSLQRTTAAINAGVPQHIELTNRVVGKEFRSDVYAAHAIGAEADNGDKGDIWRWTIGTHGDVVLMRGTGDAVVRVPLSTTGASTAAENTIATRQSCTLR